MVLNVQLALTLKISPGKQNLMSAFKQSMLAKIHKK